MSDLLQKLTDELVATTRAVSKLETFTRDILEALPDGVIVVDIAGAVLFVNLAAEVLTEYSRDEMVGKPVKMLVPRELRGAHIEHRTQYAIHPEPRPMGQGLDLQMKTKSGALVPVDILLAPVRVNGDRHTIAVMRRRNG